MFRLTVLLKQYAREVTKFVISHAFAPVTRPPLLRH